MIPKPTAPSRHSHPSAALQHDHFENYPTKDEGRDRLQTLSQNCQPEDISK
jgi:hypothetical protein